MTTHSSVFLPTSQAGLGGPGFAAGGVRGVVRGEAGLCVLNAYRVPGQAEGLSNLSEVGGRLISLGFEMMGLARCAAFRSVRQSKEETGWTGVRVV